MQPAATASTVAVTFTVAFANIAPSTVTHRIVGQGAQDTDTQMHHTNGVWSVTIQQLSFENISYKYVTDLGVEPGDTRLLPLGRAADSTLKSRGSMLTPTQTPIDPTTEIVYRHFTSDYVTIVNNRRVLNRALLKAELKQEKGHPDCNSSVQRHLFIASPTSAHNRANKVALTHMRHTWPFPIANLIGHTEFHASPDEDNPAHAEIMFTPPTVNNQRNQVAVKAVQLLQALAQAITQ